VAGSISDGTILYKMTYVNQLKAKLVVPAIAVCACSILPDDARFQHFRSRSGQRVLHVGGFFADTGCFANDLADLPYVGLIETSRLNTGAPASDEFNQVDLRDDSALSSQDERERHTPRKLNNDVQSRTIRLQEMEHLRSHKTITRAVEGRSFKDGILPL